MSEQIDGNTVTVDPNEGIDFMSFDSLKDRIEQLSPPVQNLFKVYDEQYKADLKVEKTTLEYLFDLTAEGIVRDEIAEFVESMLKECGLWPLYFNVTTKLYEPVGQKKARQTSLAGRIFNRVKTMASRKDLILDDDGMIQFYDDDGKYKLKHEGNTDLDGDFTLALKGGGKPSVTDNKKAKLAATQTRTVNPAEIKKQEQELAEQKAEVEQSQVEAADAARKHREQMELVAQGFGNTLKGVIARQKAFEELRPELVKTQIGKKVVDLLDDFFEGTQNDLYDFADVLKIKEKEGRFIVNM